MAGPVSLQAILDPRWLLRWVFIGRLCLASAIFIAAVTRWTAVDADQTLVASLAFALSAVFTVVSAGYIVIYRRRISATFLYLQAAFDILLVTAVVHVTNGNNSPFSALYILVIATASLLVPAGGGLLIAALGLVLYFADAIAFFRTPTGIEPGVWLQLGVMAIVALAVRSLATKLRESGEGKEALVAQLEQSRLQAEDILHNIRSGVITVDVEGRLLYANPMSEQLLGVNLVDHYGEPISDRIGKVAPELAIAVLRAAEGKIRTTRGEGFISTVAKQFPVGVTTTYTEHDDTGESRTATAIFQDISDAKRMDALRLRAERLEGIAELSASLAHEIKNPLASIRSAVEQLGAAPRATEDERILAHLIVRESDRLSRLLSEFLDFARVRVTRGERVNMGEVAQAAVRLADTHPDRKLGVSVTCVSPTEPLLVEGDEDLLHRAIFNITLNAVQAAPVNTGFVTVEVSRLSPEQIPTGVPFEVSAVALRVSDNGPGIPIELRERVFDPFFTTKAGGTGLGLPIVHRAIEAHRGFVFMDSSPKGTRFTVLLPQYQRRASMEGVT